MFNYTKGIEPQNDYKSMYANRYKITSRKLLEVLFFLKIQSSFLRSGIGFRRDNQCEH